MRRDTHHHAHVDDADRHEHRTGIVPWLVGALAVLLAVALMAFLNARGVR